MSALTQLWVGKRVRMTQGAITAGLAKYRKSREDICVSVSKISPYIRVCREGIGTGVQYHEKFWELIPEPAQDEEASDERLECGYCGQPITDPEKSVICECDEEFCDQECHMLHHRIHGCGGPQ